MFVEYEFLVTIEPCRITDYVGTVRVIELRYNIGATDLTDGPYSFDELPVCGYPETVTLQDLPAFVTHNGGPDDFTIPRNSDLGLIGEYTANIESLISVPDDYTMSTFTDWFVQYDFKIYIEPCLVNTYVSSLDAGPLTYSIGDPSMTDGRYIFTEDPVCNYPETVTLTDLPTWTSHNAGNSDFTIP